MKEVQYKCDIYIWWNNKSLQIYFVKKMKWPWLGKTELYRRLWTICKIFFTNIILSMYNIRQCWDVASNIRVNYCPTYIAYLLNFLPQFKFSWTLKPQLGHLHNEMPFSLITKSDVQINQSFFMLQDFSFYIWSLPNENDFSLFPKKCVLRKSGKVRNSSILVACDETDYTNI